MAQKSKAEILEALKGSIDVTSDAGIALLEDINDSFPEGAVTQADLDAAVEAKDQEWRKKYSEAFFSKPDEKLREEEPKPDPEKELTYEALFR